MVELLELTKSLDILVGDEVDGDTLATKSTGSTDTVNVVLQVARQVVVDDQGHLLDINTTGQKIGGDQNTTGTSTELVQDDITLLLRDVTMSGGHHEVLLEHLVGEPFDLSAGVAEDHSLRDVQSIVQIAKSVKFPLLAFHGNVELLNTFQGQLIALHKDADGVVHELGGNLQSLRGHGSGEEAHLDGGGQGDENVVDLVLEAHGQHLVSLIEDEGFNGLGAEVTTLEEIEHTTRGTNNDVDTLAEDLGIIGDAGSTNARMATDLKVITQVGHHLKHTE